MKLVIVSGLSGSGKSIALNTLEDSGYYCIDNLPISMIPSLATEIADNLGTRNQLFAVGIDARNNPADIEHLPEILEPLRQDGLDIEVLFLQTDNDTLIKRFSETRRKHPLATGDMTLADAIRKEHETLEPIARNADLFIDTTNTNIYQLRTQIEQRLISGSADNMSILFQSFGFKYGTPQDADFMFDARCLPNPYWEPELRPYDGRDEQIRKYLDSHDEVRDMADAIISFLHEWIPRFSSGTRNYMTIAIGCTGGKHRSVYLTERVAEQFRQIHENILVRHRELT